MKTGTDALNHDQLVAEVKRLEADLQHMGQDRCEACGLLICGDEAYLFDDQGVTWHRHCPHAEGEPEPMDCERCKQDVGSCLCDLLRPVPTGAA